MRRYIAHIQNTHTPHERRQHALQVAGLVTAALFISWLAMFGLRMSTSGPVVDDGKANTAATLNAVQDEESSPLLGY
ncbi:MAG: hypothetical protein KBD50_01145 [Candidatus Pacebacteria bacterium]|nr:hypothetical protein [Candidatus Paceibacterota bacterium]